MTMKTNRFGATTRLFLLSAFPVLGAIACGAPSGEPGAGESTGKTNSAVTTCPPGQETGASGTCQPCNSVYATAVASPTVLQGFFSALSIEDACYTVANNTGTFNLGGSACGTTYYSQLGSYVTPPPPSNVQPPTINGSVQLDPICFTGPFGIRICPGGPSVSYSAYPSIASLSLTWTDWTPSTSSSYPNTIEIDATLSAVINVHVSAAPLVVNPTLTISRLPVTIYFGSDATGNAVVDAVNVSSPGSHSSVSGCGAFGWCSGLISGSVQSSISGAIQSTISNELGSALNDQNQHPFWSTLMQALADQTNSPLDDSTGAPWVGVGKSTPGGTPTAWAEVQYRGYSSIGVSADFSSTGLCYVDCTPKTCAQDNFTCGIANDGCGGQLQCGTCGSGDICTNNTCQVCIPKTCESQSAMCGEITDGCGNNLNCGTCTDGTACSANHACVGTGGSNGTYCANCKKSGGICTVESNGTAICIHE
jgi:hypothetical protein